MNKFALIISLALSTVVSAKTYYVAPTGGSDTFPGSISQPWSSWQKAFNTAQAGDTVFFRGGTWYPASAYSGNNITYINPDDGIGHNGAPDNPICYFNYPGENPILDCKNVHATGNFLTGLMMYDVHWINWRGLTIRNVYQRKQDIEPKGISGLPVSNMTFENMTVHNIGGAGWYMESDVGVTGYGLGWDNRGYIPYDTIRYINCDTYQVCDTFRVNPGNLPGNMADGFKYISYPGAYISYEGCRAWHCSDDGFDLPGASYKVLNNCWSFNNVYQDYGFEGNGYKMGAVDPQVLSHPTGIMTNCISAFNDLGIFDLEYDGYRRTNSRFYNNSIYKCKVGIQMSDNAAYPSSQSIFKNNIIYDITTNDAGGRPYILSLDAYYQESHNTWDYAESGSLPNFEITDTVTVTDADFKSLDVNELMRPRKSNNSLPDVDFLKLALGSDLIDAGTFNLPDISGLPYYSQRNYSGLAPDLGYSEYVLGTVTPATPAVVSAAIENATPSRLDITYNLTLANIVPVASAFTVTVNSSVRTVTAVAISGTKVLLTLSGPVAYGNVVTVAYTKPLTNPLQTSAGGQAFTFTARSVTNNVAAVSPVYASSVVENATPSRLEITYNLALANVVPSTSAFTVTVNSTVRTVSSVAISGTKVLLTLSSPVAYGNVVTIAYTKPSTNPIQTSAGGQAASFTARSVTNNVAPVNPVYVSSVVENATPARLDITYNLALANIVPAASTFAVRVNSTARTVNSVVISGTKVLLTLSTPVVSGDVVTVAYTKPATNPLQTSSGGQAVSISAQSVINNCSLTANQPPVITITSPSKSLTFISPATITLEAAASDPDGSIAKVEYYNGTTLLGERTLSPYSFTWKDVLEGTYTITAVASDNLNAKTVSAAVTVVIEKAAEVVNQVPVVTIISPGRSGKYKKHDNIVIVATASDPDGTISKVELKSGDVTVGEATVSPYSFTLEDVDTGKYVLTVIATDNLGAISASSSLELFVELRDETRSTIIKLYPNPNDGHFSIDISSPVPTAENSVTIVNLTGEIIYRGLLTEGQVTEEFDMSGSPSGSYILLLHTGNTIVSSRKFIKR